MEPAEPRTWTGAKGSDEDRGGSQNGKHGEQGHSTRPLHRKSRAPLFSQYLPIVTFVPGVSGAPRPCPATHSTSPRPAMQKRISPKTLSFLTLLYFVQGLPFGFQATALPVFLRQQGVSLTRIGLLGLLRLRGS